MLNGYKQLIVNQFESALCTLAVCVDECPEENWYGPVVNMSFNQAAFHALLFTDVYLGKDLASLRGQTFHKENAAEFADYEELEKRKPKAVYEKPFIRSYVAHCREKVAESVQAETEESLARTPGFDWLKFSRAEVHVYNIRHLHHHAAQLSLRLRIDDGVEHPLDQFGLA